MQIIGSPYSHPLKPTCLSAKIHQNPRKISKVLKTNVYSSKDFLKPMHIAATVERLKKLLKPMYIAAKIEEIP